MAGHHGQWIGAACLLASTACVGAVAQRAAPPAIVTAEDWGSAPQPIPASRAHQPVRVTIHHAGVTWKAEDDPLQKIKGLQIWGQRDKGWPDVPYHFLIAPDGRIFEGRPLEFAGETNTEYDPAGHALVQIWGNFEEQRVAKAQLESCVRLVAWLCRQHGIAASTIAAHRDWSKMTSCPGRDLYRYVAGGDIRRWVETALDGEEPSIELRPPLPEGPTVPLPVGSR